jgi:myosin heavy subunit
MSSMDGDMKKDILDVRKVIERSTSKVSLRDLEKKGFRKVKVLRAGDINQLIYKAVQTVLAKQPAVGMGEEEREQVLAEAKAEYERQTKQLQEVTEAQERLEAEKAEVETRAAQIQQAHQNLEKRLQDVNAQLQVEKNKILSARSAFDEEKRQLEREKHDLSSKGFDAIQTAQKQVQDLQARLAEAESKANGAVSQEQYNQLHAEARERVSGLQTKIEELERELRKTESDAELTVETATAKTKSLQAQLEDSEARARKLAIRVGELEGELEKAPKAGAADGADVEKLRAEMLAREAAQQEMFKELLTAVKTAPAPAAAAAAPGGDFEKSLKAMQQNLVDTMRKFAGSGMKGGFEENSASDIGAILAGQADIQLETNIKDVGVKEQSAKGVKDKLSKLRNMRGGGPK